MYYKYEVIAEKVAYYDFEDRDGKEYDLLKVVYMGKFHDTPLQAMAEFERLKRSGRFWDATLSILPVSPQEARYTEVFCTFCEESGYA